MTSLGIRNTWPGLLLLSVLTASLWCTVASAHEAPHGDHHFEEEHPGTEPDPAAAPARTTVTNLITAFRRTGDDLHLEHAWSMLEPLLASGTNDPHLLIDAAMVAQSRHEFDTALELVDRSLRLAGNNDQAWLLNASIHLVRGNVDQAERACDELRHVPPLVVITCYARVSIASGDHAEALPRLTALLDSGATKSLSPELFAWSLGVAGDAAAPVTRGQAAELYKRSLGVVESAQVRAALVDVLLAENRLEDADIALRDGADALPLAVRRMILAKRIGDGSAAERIAATDHEFRHWIASEDWLHAREMARFYLDVVQRPALARHLAEINLATQREPEDLLLVSRTRGL